MTEVIEKPRLINVNPQYWDILQSLLATSEAVSTDPSKADDFATFFTENPQYRFANFDPIITREAIKDSMMRFSSQVKGLHHIVKTVWQPETDVVIAEIALEFYRFDEKTVTLPVMDFFRFEGDWISEMRVSVDINPVFA